MEPLVFCTLFDSNYMDKGLVMYYSLTRNVKNFRLYVLAMDDACFTVLSDLRSDKLVPVKLSDFEDEELVAARQNRSRGEYCWTCSSSFIEYVIKTYQERQCTYLDSDLYFFSNPKCLLDEMGEKTVQIVEHRFADTIEDRQRMLASGRYCVEFNTFKNEDTSMKLLHWWKEQCIKSCGMEDKKTHTLGDQTYLQGWERNSFVSILKNLGGGVAPWNVSQYRLKDKNNSKIILTEKKSGFDFELVFYHFHNISYYDRETVDINVYKSYWNVDDKLIKTIYYPYLKEINEMKNLLNDKYGIYPLITKHPAIKVENNQIHKRIRLTRGSLLGILLKGNSIFRMFMQGKTDIIKL